MTWSVLTSKNMEVFARWSWPRCLGLLNVADTSDKPGCKTQSQADKTLQEINMKDIKLVKTVVDDVHFLRRNMYVFGAVVRHGDMRFNDSEHVVDIDGHHVAVSIVNEWLVDKTDLCLYKFEVQAWDDSLDPFGERDDDGTLLDEVGKYGSVAECVISVDNKGYIKAMKITYKIGE